MLDSLYTAIVSGQMPFDAFCGLMLIVIVVAAIPVCFIGAAIARYNRPEAKRRRYYAARRARRAI